MEPDPTSARKTPPASEVLGAARDGVRLRNERQILSFIHQSGAAAKADIARALGLSAQTVSVIMRNLEADGLLRRGEPVRGRVGQPSVPMGLARDGAFALGLKVGRRSLEMVLVDFAGTVRHRMRRTHGYPDPDATREFARTAHAALLAKLAPHLRARVAGLGIALPFHLWQWAEPMGAPLQALAGWRRCDLAAELRQILDCPVLLQNDASAACGAELTFGTAPRAEDFLHFYIAFFAGGGVVQAGEVRTGPRGNAGALGAIPVPGPDGICRQLIDFASLFELEKMLQAAGLSAELLWGPPESWDLPEAIVEEWLANASWGLAHAALAATAVTDSALVLIDGWLPEALRDRLVTDTRARLAQVPHAGLDLPAIAAGSIGADARALGAAGLVLSERFFPGIAPAPDPAARENPDAIVA